MRPFKRVKMLNADEYRVLKRALASRKIAAGKARRAKIVLLSNQGLTARERTLYPPNSTFGGCLSTRSRDIVVKANRWKENRDGKADRDHAGHRRRRHRPGRRVGAAGRRPWRLLVRASGEIKRAGAGPQDLRGAGRVLAEPVGQVGGHGQSDAEVRRVQHPVRRSRVERDPARGEPRGLDPEAEGRGRR